MSNSKIIIGVTGGVAAYKTATLVSRLVQRGDDVSVVMTESAKQFIGGATFAALTGKQVWSSIFDDSQPLGAHITLAQEADLLCVAPTSANTIGKFAQGLADDLLSTLYLSRTCPVLIAPAMNCEMWDKPAVQRNVKQLQADGVSLVGPEEGWLSCRQLGAGRMSEPESILAAIDSVLDR